MSSATTVALVGGVSSKVQAEDLRWYVRTSEDYRSVVSVKQIPLPERWDHWVLMPWRHNWGRLYDDALLQSMKAAGFNGGACDHTPRTDADLHEKHGLLWFLDHAAGKGDLHLLDEVNTPAHRNAPRRPRCLLDPVVRARLQERLLQSIQASKKYKTRIAYSLDDEISWSTHTNPCQWDNHPVVIRAFKQWLLNRYGSRAALLRQWDEDNEQFMNRMATPDDFQHLYRRPVTQWNLSPWCDALSYMDSQILNLVGELVLVANGVDPVTPCGLVGAQGPAPYGGYDYTKLMRKVQFLEVYNIGAAMEIARSFNANRDVAVVSAGVGDPDGPHGEWASWYGLAHGCRGAIAYADGWFGPNRDMLRLGPSVRKIAEVSHKLFDARWRHDGVALYYSHPSIQVSWFMDCHAHGRTWINRLGSVNDRLSSSNAAFWAWTRLLEDLHVQYNFVAYPDVVARKLDPAEYKVLILPRVLAVSDEEIEAIARYVRQGGIVIADHMVGLFDHHGRGRRRAAFDDLLGISTHPAVMAGNVFGGRLLTEFDAESHWQDTFTKAGEDYWSKCKRAKGFPIVESSLGPFVAGRHGTGWIMLMNVSLAEYCLCRDQAPQKALEMRSIISESLDRAGIRAALSLKVDGAEPPITEVTYWEFKDRLMVCVVKNPLRLGGLESTAGVGKGTVGLRIRFDQPMKNVIDERLGRSLGDGAEFEVRWKTDEAAILSMSIPEKENLTTTSKAADHKSSESAP